MSENQNEKRVRLDLNNEVFQENLLGLDKAESARVLNTLTSYHAGTARDGVP